MSWLSNLKIKQKLIIAFLIIGALTGFVGIIGTRNMSEINSNQINMYDVDFTGVKSISEVKANLIQINFDIYKILSETNIDKRKALEEEIEYLRKEDDRLLLAYEKTIVFDRDREMYKIFNEILKEYRTYRRELLSTINNDRKEEAVVIYTKLDKVNTRIIKYIDSYIKYKDGLAKQSYDDNKFLYRQTYVIYILITAFSVLLAIMLALRISTKISNQIRKVLSFAEALSKGNLGHVIRVESNDEISELAIALNEAAATRLGYEEELSSSYEELEASYEEITALESDLREKYQELESSFEEITALEEELREKYNEIAESEDNLRNRNEWYELVNEASYDILWDWNIRDDTLVFSNRWYEVLGYENGAINTSRDWHKLIHPEDVNAVIETIRMHWQDRTETYTVQYRIITKDEKILWISANGRTIYDSEGLPYRTVGCNRDITEMKEYQRQLEHLAYHDYLTNLPSRQYMYKRLDASLGKVAVIFIDIDNFKYINDTMGHTYGDKLIKLVAERMSSLVGREDTIIRFGGDEFIIYLKDMESKTVVEEFAVRLLRELNAPFEVMHNSVNITASLGIAMSPQDGITMDELLKKADIAMYQSKYEGKNSYTFFASNMNDDIVERMNIEKYLRKALNNEEFILHYQPQIEVETGKVSGFEALIRWISPEMGFISPAKFIPIAEENHMIIDIGNWVLRTACKFIKQIHGAGRTECYMSVNVSILQLIQSDFTDNVAGLLEELKLLPQYLELEITESVFIDSYEIIRINIERLKRLGVRIALDDFGKGYSSLSYLKQLPINTLKIDKSFVDDINSEIDDTLVENIIMIGHKMGLEVVAEGVELEDQAKYLKNFRCDKIQGYLYSKPVPSEVALDMVINN